MMHKLDDKHVVFWDEPTEAVVGEAAIVLTRYTDVLELKQKEQEILVSLEQVDGLIKAMRLAVKVCK